MKDSVVVGFTGGLLGTLGDEVVHWLAVLLKIAGSTTGHYISQLIFPHQKVTLEKLLMSEGTHLLAGGILGIAIVVVYKITGYDYAIFKGVGFGALMWIVHVIVIPNMVAPRPFIFRTFNEALVDMASHLVWGGIAAYFIILNLHPAPHTGKT
jgi:uncharacterized membrane protein YagU involved in acid resistance